MINWNYNSNDVDEGFPLIPEGNYRVRIDEAVEKKSKTGKDMIEITLKVSNQPGHLYYYLVFMPDNTTMTNTNLKRLWDSFGITQGDMNTNNWLGKVGACRVKHDDYNGDKTARVAYFIDKSKQGSLPEWVEKGLPLHTAPVAPIDESDLPF